MAGTLNTMQAAAAKSATFNTGSFDTTNYSQVTALLRVSNVSGTSPTLDSKVQGSMDDSNWFDMQDAFHLGDFWRITAVDQQFVYFDKFPKYLRIRNVIDGESPVFTMEVKVVAK
jgi:hypothetical protein|tara:strand:+ start:19526 stop:19870 length:345 start_codon:yes stop_codon:yes gene_type:complete